MHIHTQNSYNFLRSLYFRLFLFFSVHVYMHVYSATHFNNFIVCLVGKYTFLFQTNYLGLLKKDIGKNNDFFFFFWYFIPKAHPKALGFSHKVASIYSESKSKEKRIYMRPTNQAGSEFQIQRIKRFIKMCQLITSRLCFQNSQWPPLR